MASDAPRPLLTLAVAGCALVAWIGSHLVMEPVSRWAETEAGAYLWKTEEWLQILSASNYADRGRGRLWMFGPSESREAFDAERLSAALPGLHAYQNAQSVGTLDDGLVALRYIEAEYGPTAIPDAVLLGVTTRAVANIRGVPSPLFQALDKYSPSWGVDAEARPPVLVEKGPLAGLRSRLRFRGHQQRRYRNALACVALTTIDRVRPGGGGFTKARCNLTPYKYRHTSPQPLARIVAWLKEPKGFWAEAGTWRPTENEARIRGAFAAWRAFAARHGIELYVVNMPELSYNRGLYQPGVYDAYLSLVRECLGDTPFLDLRTALPDDEFHDWCHPRAVGAHRVSDRIAAFIAEHRARGSEDG